MNHSSEIVKAAYAALSDKKGEDISIIDIRSVSVMADYFIIASGSNSNQVQVEGYQSANWILMDYGDIIVHVFDRDNRLFYDLERIWRDGKRLDVSELE